MIKSIYRFFHHRWKKHYSKSHWHLILELSSVIIIIFLIAICLGLYFFRPSFPSFGVFKPPVVNLNNPPLDLDFSLPEQIIASPQMVALKLNFKNNNNIAPVNNLKIDLKTSDDNFILTKIIIATSTTSAEVSGSELSINRIGIKKSGSIDLLLYFKAKNSSARIIKWQEETEYNFSRQVIRDTNNLPDLKIAAKLNIKDGVYYTSSQGDQLGIGPVPPIVGIPTVYWVSWEVKSLDSFSNLIFSAHLPDGVDLGKQQSLLAGKFNYNSANRQIVWKIPELKSEANNYRLGFEVQIVPRNKDYGQVLTLLDHVQYYGHNNFTEQDISGYLENLDTNLKADHFNSGQGKVIAQ